MNTLSLKEYAHRCGSKTLKLVGADGAPIQGKALRVRQLKHKFLFGCAEFSALPYANNELEGQSLDLAEERFRKFFEVFNFVTLPFYWGRYEPLKGQPDTQRTRTAAQWLVSKGCTLKGHPLCWHTVCADWLMSLDNRSIMETQLARIHRDVRDFSGLIDMWDVINEVVIMPIFKKYDNAVTRICKEYGRIPLVRRVFDAARHTNPDAVLLINDFETSEAYDILIEGCLESGIRFDAIGIQSHMHQGYWGTEKTLEVLERFSRFRLPIHFTENTLVSGHLMPSQIMDLNDFKADEWPTTPEGEARQAEELVTHYRTLFSHPLVASITWWDFADGGWLGAPSGLVRRDSSAKPAYEALHKLVREDWWTAPMELLTDTSGHVHFKGFFGDYELSYEGTIKAFTLDNNHLEETILL